MTTVNFETADHTTAKVQSTAAQNPAIPNHAHRKQGERRPEAPRRSLLRKIRVKIGGKVADLFTW